MCTDLPLDQILHLGLLLPSLTLLPLSYYIVYLVFTFGIIAFSTIILHQHILLLESQAAETKLKWV